MRPPSGALAAESAKRSACMPDALPMDWLQVFAQGQQTLISGSKDGHVRCWDLSTQHCFQTLVSPAHEVRPSN